METIQSALIQYARLPVVYLAAFLIAQPVTTDQEVPSTNGSTVPPVSATIPIAIQGGKLHVRGTVNNSLPLDLIFDTGANANVLYPSAFAKGAELHFDGMTDNVGTGGVTRRQTSSNNHLEIAKVALDDELFLYVEKQADDADGIVGYTAFSDKIIEIDYDRMLMTIHDSLPKHAAEYTVTALSLVGPLTAIEVTMNYAKHKATGQFRIDTAGSGTMNVNQAFDEAHALRAKTRLLGTSTSHGVGSGAIHNDIVLLPHLELAGSSLPNVPIHVQRPSPDESEVPGGTLNMEVLRRFNAFFDYRNNKAYMKPNGHFHVPFEMHSSGPPWLAIISISLLFLAPIGFFLARRSVTQKSKN